ncbi:hypothetical protein TUM19329_04470 [Legionella antarctica]|uniref:Uncharacterized protein n=2 Tax=Legionella antarctica TaxID=2708020 RepID=A0A6F8T270_9GAMM|nr:hypothetical protein TUM19329_04470 [Legionella antarctica]
MPAKPPAPDALTHDAITTILKSLGHPEFEGVCYGFTLNWALAAATHKEKLFYRQIHLLRVHQTNLPAAIKRVQDKKLHNKFLTADEKIIETLPALCKRICVAQEPLDYKKKYRKLVWQSDVSTILATISSAPARPKQIFYKTHTFASRKEAEAYFNLLKNIGINSKIAVMISSDDHAMGFRRSGNLWRFININDLYEQQVKQPYFMFTSKQLVNELYRVSTSEPAIQRLTVSTDFIALKYDGQLFQLLLNVFPSYPVKSRISYPEKISFFTMAALQGDVSTVKKCLNAGWSISLNCKISDHSPLLTAVQHGRREVVKEMISLTHYRINQRRKKDGATLLHIVCKFGGTDMVEDVLKIKEIDINSRDKKGRTPLMIICKSTIITSESKLFELLLGKGASLRIRDKEGRTALEHAVKYNNKVAIKAIQTQLKEKISVSKAAFFNQMHQKFSVTNSIGHHPNEQDYDQNGCCTPAKNISLMHLASSRNLI